MKFTRSDLKSPLFTGIHAEPVLSYAFFLRVHPDLKNDYKYNDYKRNDYAILQQRKRTVTHATASKFVNLQI